MQGTDALKKCSAIQKCPQRLSCRCSRLGRMGAMEAQLSPINAHISASGRVQTQRWDMRLATGAGRRIHLASWGAAHLAEGGPLDVTVCVAGDTLQQLGLSFPPESGIPVHVGGTASQPALAGVARWARAGCGDGWVHAPRGCQLSVLVSKQQPPACHRLRGSPLPCTGMQGFQAGGPAAFKAAGREAGGKGGASAGARAAGAGGGAARFRAPRELAHAAGRGTAVERGACGCYIQAGKLSYGQPAMLCIACGCIEACANARTLISDN